MAAQPPVDQSYQARSIEGIVGVHERIAHAESLRGTGKAAPDVRSVT
jgi:hypothetical protein